MIVSIMVEKVSGNFPDSGWGRCGRGHGPLRHAGQSPSQPCNCPQLHHTVL